MTDEDLKLRKYVKRGVKYYNKVQTEVLINNQTYTEEEAVNLIMRLVEEQAEFLLKDQGRVAQNSRISGVGKDEVICYYLSEMPEMDDELGLYEAVISWSRCNTVDDSLKFNLAKIIYSSDHFLKFLGPDKEFLSKIGDRGEANGFVDFWNSVQELSDYYEMDIPYIDRDGGTVEVCIL